ncbi:MAG: PfaD family polyunsaturated fatty acid/polyketide biosynthesis protein [Synechococcaceae cyanobacterium]
MLSLNCYWKPPGQAQFDSGPLAIFDALDHCEQPYWLIGLQEPGGLRLVPVRGGEITSASDPGTIPIHGLISPVYAEWLGDRGFCEDHGTRYAYVTGAMATGIASVELVCAGARAGFLSFFGAGGLSLKQVTGCLDRISEDLAQEPGAAWGVNLIHSPDQPALEEALVDLFLSRGVRRIEASAFMGLSPALVRYAASGLHLDAWGRLHRPNRVMAKISRPEVARHFLQPPPSDLLAELVDAGALSAEEGRLAALVPLADDVTCESDSGGHTDGRPLAVLLPVIRQLRDRLAPADGWPRPVRIGAAGGLGDPAALAAAFALGADYVVTGTVNQLARESGTSDSARMLLAQAGFADVTMAPAADMFEMGVRVQVLRRGTLFPQRAARLYDIYRRFGSLEELPKDLLEMLERDIFKIPLDVIWDECQRFWQGREPAQLDKALRDPHHRMALIFRWYLGMSNRWAREGAPERQQDYQIWCGPAIGAFNAWVQGTPLAEPQSRTVEAIGLNLLAGAVRLTRAQQLRAAGVAVPDGAFIANPMAVAASR